MSPSITESEPSPDGRLAKKPWWTRPPGGIFYAAVFAAVLPSWSAVQEPKGYFNRELASALSLVLWIPIGITWAVRVIGALCHVEPGPVRPLRPPRVGWWLAPAIATGLILLGATEALPRLSDHPDFGDPTANLRNAEEAFEATLRAAELTATTEDVEHERNSCEVDTMSDSLSVYTVHLEEARMRPLLREITQFWSTLDVVHVDRPPTDPNDSNWVTATLTDGTYLVAGQPPDGVFELSAITDCTRRE